MLSIAERHKYILDSLNKHGFVRITDVANELGVTKVTIRKDIKILESKGLLYKVHGSARPANPHVADLDVHVKDNINRDAKRRIAQRAADGWRYVGWLPTTQRATGQIDRIDLIFEREVQTP